MSKNENSLTYRGWGVVFTCFPARSCQLGFRLLRPRNFHPGIAEISRVVCNANVERHHGLLFRQRRSGRLCQLSYCRVRSKDRCSCRSHLHVELRRRLFPGLVEPWQLFLVYLVMAIGWAATTIAAISNILSLWFRERLGLAVSLALNGASAGGIVVLPILVYLTARYGFSSTMTMATLFAALILLPTVVYWVGNPTTVSTDENSIASTKKELGLTRMQALSTFNFWTIAGAFALILLVQVGFLVHQLALLETRVGREQAGIIIAVTGGMAVVGRVAIGFVIDRLNQRIVSAVSMFSQALALAIIALTNDDMVLLAGCALFGASVGNMITFHALIIRKEFDLVDFGMLTGLATAIGQFTYAFGPMMLGVLRDYYGDYRTPLLICVLLQLAAGLVVMLRGRDRSSIASQHA